MACIAIVSTFLEGFVGFAIIKNLIAQITLNYFIIIHKLLFSIPKYIYVNVHWHSCIFSRCDRNTDFSTWNIVSRGHFQKEQYFSQRENNCYRNLRTEKYALIQVMQRISNFPKNNQIQTQIRVDDDRPSQTIF